MDEDNNTKEVYFNLYCSQCEFETTSETEPPCDDCLVEPMNINSHKPIKFKAKEATK